MSSRPPLERVALPRVTDRLSFLYVERCVIHRDQNSLTIRDEEGTVRVPAASITTLLLGPGTSISHQAVSLVAECGVTCVWVGENSVRYYAHGRSLAQSTALLQEQARKVSNERLRLEVARSMYSMRFAGEDVSALPMRALRGREGARMREIYKENSLRTGVAWTRRTYDPNRFSDGDPINQALSVANYSLYGVIHAVIVSLGCSAGLGFVHVGHDRSFVYDIADLYKAETSIPIAFDVARDYPDDCVVMARKKMRDSIFEKKIIERAVRDVKILLEGEAVTAEQLESNVVSLWDLKQSSVAAGTNYADF
ncbi:type I-E CRISPR-associated endonuclease Cas1e [Gleimia europaea]|uniref:CRISPR-associated endonuclease Cas1 n=1 Tax=Gleimia europaea ACS-120-V-Col10b TaxID=883069 RepID=A0A9W5RFH1_9ACTO|nr:type I-E CRISPR-associated endonuclease Cas1e [Gleimia europaea]EPD31452.1 CRISPR-associated endonuclease cas1, subtype I-e [Gleimia europaea ACS-120-V-Col10b]